MNFDELKSQWPQLQTLSERPVAYFCAEFALSDELPIYSGGLGILAGDVIRQANHWNFPLIGIGLLYKEGYFKQVISDAATQDELPAYLNLPHALAPVRDAQGKVAQIKLPIANRIIHARIWQYTEGATRVLLLDTDVPENSELDRRLTLNLYPTDSDWRIQQQIILGIGGVRALAELGIEPSVYHLNEGHSAFAIMEIAHQYMKRTQSLFSEGLAYACRRTVFTNHTLIPSGNDIFDRSIVARLISGYADHLGLPIDEVMRMGAIPTNPAYFSMTHLALSACFKASAVSKSHAQLAKTLWPDAQLIPITNGANRNFWQEEAWTNIDNKLQRGLEVTDEEIWQIHRDLKRRLLRHILNTINQQLNPDILTITWARRIATYKQPLLLFSDINRLVRITNDQTRPVQIILAGKAHPGDLSAKAMISEILKIINQPGLAGRVVFLANYNLELARLLVTGSDVWLNTPIKGQEACGTSGMKAGLNGSLQCAISDGWTDEIDLPKLGFPIDPTNSAVDIYNVLEQKVGPLYYGRGAGNQVPADWITMMRAIITQTSAHFTSERMMREYITQLYLPTLQQPE
ncbi:MAG: alpha-glucan family phosphorylase [Patescibacteria group bacterium]